MRFPFKEFDKSLLVGSALKTWAGLLMKATITHGCSMDSAKKCKSQLQDAGFIDIVETTYKWPQNRWPKHRKHMVLGMFYFILPRGSSSANKEKRSVGSCEL
jgi:hypothetical protein